MKIRRGNINPGSVDTHALVLLVAWTVKGFGWGAPLLRNSGRRSTCRRISGVGWWLGTVDTDGVGSKLEA